MQLLWSLLVLTNGALAAQSMQKAIIKDSILHVFANPAPPKAEFVLTINGRDKAVTKYYTPVVDGPLFPTVYGMSAGRFYWLHGFGVLPNQGKVLVSGFAPVTYAACARIPTSDWRLHPIDRVFKKVGLIERISTAHPKKIATSVSPVFDWILLNVTLDEATWYSAGVLPNDVDLTFQENDLFLYLRKKNQIEFWRRSGIEEDRASWENTINFSRDSTWLQAATDIPGKIKFREERMNLSDAAVFSGENTLFQLNGRLYLLNQDSLTVFAVEKSITPIVRIVGVGKKHRIFGTYYFIEDRDSAKIYFPGELEILNEDDNLSAFQPFPVTEMMARFFD